MGMQSTLQTPVPQRCLFLRNSRCGKSGAMSTDKETKADIPSRSTNFVQADCRGDYGYSSATLDR